MKPTKVNPDRHPEKNIANLQQEMERQLVNPVEERRAEVKEYFLMGWDLIKIKKDISAKYGVKLITVNHDLIEVKKDLRKYAKDIQLIEEHVGKYDLIYNKAMQKGDRKNALQALRQKEELLRMVDRPGNINIVQYNNEINIEANFEAVDVQTLLKIKQLLDGGEENR